MDWYIIWIIIIIASIIIEAITLGLTSIWFAPAALITMLFSFTGIPFWLQVIIFVILSALMIMFLYPIAKQKLKIGQTKTNYESVIGSEGIVIETINNLNAKGQVKVGGQIWTARAVADIEIEVGHKVRIVEI